MSFCSTCESANPSEWRSTASPPAVTPAWAVAVSAGPCSCCQRIVLKVRPSMDNKSVIPAGRTIAKSIELVELPADTSANKPAFGTQLELIQNVKVSLSALIGRCEMTVAELFALKEGAVVPLDRDTREPVDIYLDERLVGRAELVVVGDNFGLRIVELGSQSGE